MIKTFRGLLDSSTEEKVRLSTKQGKIGYRIIKFSIMPNTPGATSDFEGVVKIFKVSQLTFDSTVDFTDAQLLGAAYYQDNAGEHYPSSLDIIFDREIFNQDIYVSYVRNTGSQKANYYIELEVMDLNDNEAQVSTLMDIRGS